MQHNTTFFTNYIEFWFVLFVNVHVRADFYEP